MKFKIGISIIMFVLFLTLIALGYGGRGQASSVVVVVYHPIPLVIDSQATLQKKKTLLESSAFYSLDDALKFMESTKIDEASLIGVYELGKRIEVKAINVPMLAAPPQIKRWQKAP